MLVVALAPPIPNGTSSSKKARSLGSGQSLGRHRVSPHHSTGSLNGPRDPVPNPVPAGDFVFGDVTIILGQGSKSRR